MLTRSEFLALCREASRQLAHQSEDYLHYHFHRLYATYTLCRAAPGSDGNILSIGAGSAFVEFALAKELGARVTVVDFPQALESNRRHFAAAGFMTLPADLSLENPFVAGVSADLLLSAEILEHLPIPPSVHFSSVAASLKPGGWCVATTPNLGSLRHVLKLLWMRPLLPPPELTFSEPSFETEGVHRREYMTSEIVAAMRAAGIEAKNIRYSWYHRPRSMSERVIFPAETLVPRFRPLLLCAGTKLAE